MDKKGDPVFETEEERLEFCRKKAEEAIGSLPKDVVEELGRENLISEMMYELLVLYPVSRESQRKQLADIGMENSV